MIELALDPSDTRPSRPPEAQPARGRPLSAALLGLAGVGMLGGFGVAASTLMAGLAAPQPAKLAAPGRAADWPDLKDGLPAVIGARPAVAAAPKTVGKGAEPEAPALRMASLPDAVAGFASAAGPAAPRAAAAAPEAPAKRIPVPTPVAPIGPTRQAVPIGPARVAAIQPPRAAETVRARDLVEPAAPPPPVAAPVVSAPAAAAPEKPAKAAAARKPPVGEKAAKLADKGADKTVGAGKGKNSAPAAVAQAEAPEQEEAEILGIKLPSLAPAGRKLKEGVDAIGDAVKSVF